MGEAVMRLRGLLLLLTGLLVTSPLAAAPKVHVVEKGHSLWSIAKRYGVTVKAIEAQNGLRSGAAIRPGQRLEIPEPGQKASPKKSDAKAEPSKSKADSGKAGSEKAESKVDWVNAKPDASTQTQKSAKDRGVNPCNTPDPGQGIYTRWDRAPSLGQMIMPERGGVTANGGFDVMFHFHGHEPVRKEWVKVMNGAVLVGVDLGIGSGPYESTFRSPDAFRRLMASVEKRVAERTGKKRVYIRKMGLSAWSAGYGAVESILRHPEFKQKVDAVVLLDGLHSANTEPMKSKQLEPFVEFARLAARRQRFMFVSHSSIIPPGYASTTETANFLIHALGGKPKAERPRGADPMGLERIASYSRGNFHVRGYRGNDKMDHCAHIGLFKDVLKVHVSRRWSSPRGYGPKAPSREPAQVTASR